MENILQQFSTVGELMDILSKFSRDTKIVTYDSNMEHLGYTNKIWINTQPRKFSGVQKYASDAFDGTSYTYDTLVPDTNGTIEAIEI